MSDSKLFATEKKSPDIIVIPLEWAKHQQQAVSRIHPWQNHSVAEVALCCCRLHGLRGDHRAGSWEAETRTYSSWGNLFVLAAYGIFFRRRSGMNMLSNSAFKMPPTGFYS
jgi:hypothetical protein